MREIKFRVWDGSRMVKADNSSLFGMFEGGTAPVMQYTGLKDKNGTEIYEGDIMRNVLDELLLVEYSHNKFTVPPFYMDNEVIGNQFENPELLK